MVQNSSTYRISIRSPSGCNQSSNGCNYFLGINTNNKNSNYLDFTLEGKAKGWVAVGFSKTPNMVWNYINFRLGHFKGDSTRENYYAL